MRHALEDGVDEAIVPGDPDRSQAYRRMTAADLLRMPPKGHEGGGRDGQRAHP